MAEIKIFNPEGMNRPRTPFMQVARVKTSELAFIAGQVPVYANGGPVGEGDFEAQCALVFDNIRVALRSVGADWRNVVEFTTYMTNRKNVGLFAAWRAREFPKMFPDGAYPPNTLLVVNGLAQDFYLLEVQTTAAL